MKIRTTILLLVLMTVAVVGGSTPISAQAPPPECSDGTDNDNDGATDFPDDQHCENPEDNSEYGHSDHLNHVTIRFSERGDVFRGRVHASLNACKPNRAVIVRKAVPGKDEVVWRAGTDPEGRWRTKPFPRAQGRYYAFLPQQVVRTDEGYASCGQPDRSEAIRV